jgi:hypothetical protein
MVAFQCSALLAKKGESRSQLIGQKEYPQIRRKFRRSEGISAGHEENSQVRRNTGMSGGKLVGQGFSPGISGSQ